jgi:CHAT domain-containing protein/tetratricopeptide (TPR) repeat protein
MTMRSHPSTVAMRVGLLALLFATASSSYDQTSSAAQTSAGAAQSSTPAQTSQQERLTRLQARVTELEQSGAPNDPALATALNDLAIFYFTQADYAAAEPLLRRAVAIREEALGADAPQTAQAINNLAQVLQERGNYVDAEPLLERSLKTYETLRGPDHPDVATALNNLAGLYRLMGNARRAEPLYLRALAIREKAVGADHPTLAPILNNLALTYQQDGDAVKARPLFERSLAIREKALGPDHADVGRTLNNLAVLSQEQGDLDTAGMLYRRAIQIYEKAFSRQHPLVGQALNNLAVVYLLQGDYATAGPMYHEALAIRSAALGPHHPDMARALTSEAIFFDVTGRKAEAVARQAQAAEVVEGNLTLILATGSEVQKLRYMETFTEDTDITVSMDRQSKTPSVEATRLAMTTLLRRKGRVLDAVSGTAQTLRERLSPEDRAALDRLSSSRSRLAALVLRGPGSQNMQAFNASVAKLEGEVQESEREVSSRSALYRSQSPLVTIDAVQAGLDPESALIEVALYRPFDNRVAQRARRFGEPRYAAYVLRRTGEPISIDLGEAATIDRQADLLRRALRDPKDTGVRKPAAALYQLVMAPLRSVLGDATRLLVSPDGSLNLVPFAALVGADGRYLLESRTITYLSSGRDLLRLKEHAVASSAPLVVANPEFMATSGKVAVPGAAADPANRAVDLSRAVFNPLPGTAAEAESLRSLLPGASVLTGRAATESAVKAAHAPVVLHLATHGFFLGSDQKATTERGRLLVQIASTDSGPSSAIENPLLRSGLAFAGANERLGGGNDDGILTALEASSLDLWGTRMAVLSACETGLGETRRGDGVYGLRRALVMAGAESQVMSLWQVSDEGTRALMTGFYTALKVSRARSAALRDTQIEMLRSAKRSHPYYWASFILSGADGPIAFQ